MATRRHENILLKGIHIEKGRLPLVEAHVIRLMKSIEEVGLLEPIIVCRRTKESPALVLVAGRHRLEACKRLKHDSISAIVENKESDAVDKWRALAEIDENLIRRDLSPAQRAKLIGKRKAAYETLHPETKHGATPGKKGGGKSKGAESASFAKNTAAKTGKSARSIKEDATRAKRLGADLDRIAGTTLDKSSELDALGKMPPSHRNEIITRAASGEEVSAIKEAESQVSLRGLANLKKKWNSFCNAWDHASVEACEEFLAECRDEV
jgi:ParB-like nuclease family protein